MMSEKFLHAYQGMVSEATLAFSFPAKNKEKVLRYLSDTKQIDKYIIVDPEEEARMKAQQAAILAKFAAPTPLNERMDVTIEDQPTKSRRK